MWNSFYNNVITPPEFPGSQSRKWPKWPVQFWPRVKGPGLTEFRVPSFQNRCHSQIPDNREWQINGHSEFIVRIYIWKSIELTDSGASQKWKIDRHSDPGSSPGWQIQSPFFQNSFNSQIPEQVGNGKLTVILNLFQNLHLKVNLNSQIPEQVRNGKISIFI